MKNVVGTFLIFTLVGTLNSCDEPAKEKTPEQLRVEAKTAIAEEREALLNAKGALDTNRATNMIDMYLTFVKSNSGDLDAAEYTFQAASLCMGKGDYDRSITLFKNVVRNYPDDKRVVEAYFLIGFINDTYLNRKGEAETWYRKVIEYYPNHDLSLQASAAIRNLTMSDEELIQMFEEKNGL